MALEEFDSALETLRGNSVKVTMFQVRDFIIFVNKWFCSDLRTCHTT